MAVTINADTSNGVIITPDTSGEIELQANGVTKAKITANGLQDANGNSLRGGMYRNRIINGDMRIDQRNAGASATVSGSNIFSVDRWSAFSTSPAVYTIQQSTDAPAGFVNSVVITVTTPDSSLAAGDFNAFRQSIEGLNCGDLGWGTANAKTVTLSFWVKSSLTGTFTVAFRNSAVNRSYIAPYTINTANTWEKKSATIAGDTTGTWLTTNGIGIRLDWSLGLGSDFQGTTDAWTATNDITTSGSTSVVGTNGATWYITGVQLEVGEGASDFEHLPYDVQLQRCQRYFSRLGSGAWGLIYSGSNADVGVQFPITMRSTPSVSHLANYQITLIATAEYTVTNTIINPSVSNSVNGIFVRLTSTGMSSGNCCISTANNIGFSAEL